MPLKNNPKKMQEYFKNDNVLTELEERYCYSVDASNCLSEVRVPDLVVFAETIQDVQKVLKYANKNKIPVVSRGAGTNMVGSCLCNSGGIVLNFSKMNKIIDFNPSNMTIKVQPGVILGELKSYVEKFGLFFPPDPSNSKVSTVGGAIAQSSAGANSYKYGTIKDYVLSLSVVTADGTLVKFGADTVKDSAGYHLAQLMVGSEGTLCVIVEATLKLIVKPETKTVISAYFNDISDAVNAVNTIINAKISPCAIDFMDNVALKTVEEFAKIGLRTKMSGLILIDVDGNKATVEGQADKIKDILNFCNVQFIEQSTSDDDYEKKWNARRVSFAATSRLAPDVISEDVIVPRDKLSDMLEFCNSIRNKYSLKMSIVGHVADGNIHPQIALDLNNEEEFRNYREAKNELYKHSLDLGGSFSAEHGIGLEKMTFFEENSDSVALNYMRQIKKIFDPNNILNTDKLFKIE